MTDAVPPAGDDSILPFQLDRADMRGRVGRLDATLDAILGQHAYPAPVSGLVAEAALLTALIGQTMKLRWRLSLQIRGEDAIRLIATDYFAPSAEGEAATIRAYASFDADKMRDDVPAFTLFGKGLFGMIIDQGKGMTPYQGLTPLSGGSLAACAETYFAQSEQLATRFVLSAGLAQAPGEDAGWRGGGLMVQHLADPGEHVRDAPSGEDGLMAAADVAAMGDGEEDWTRINMLLDTVEATELIGPYISPDRLLLRLFHEETPRVTPPQRVRFGCTCSAEKVVNAMAQYSARDIGHMTNDAGELTADCQFCGQHYAFDPEALGFEATRPVEDL